MPSAREVIPFRERKQDIVLWIFFLVNVIFVTYQADIEQLVIRDPDNFTYPIWPPAYMIDFLHWYFEKYDPLLYERPVWYTTIVVHRPGRLRPLLHRCALRVLEGQGVDPKLVDHLGVRDARHGHGHSR